MGHLRYAVISDIHGNLPALEAVLRDAEERGVDGYVLLGDYCCDFPWYDEVVDTIRGLPNVRIVRGNKEDYLENLVGKDQSAWTDGQMAAIYHMYRSLSDESRDYLCALPEELAWTDEDGGYAHAFHKPNQLFDGTRMMEIRSTKYYRLKERHGFDFDSLGALTKELDADPILKEILDGLTGGLYLFGHNHIQWSGMLYGKLLVNPGSCGLPLDNNCAAPYAIVESRNGRWTATLCRADYDIAGLADFTRKSPLYEVAPVWCQVMLGELLHSREFVQFFLNHVEDYAQSIGDTARPYSFATWNAAFAAWPEKP